MPSIRPLTTIRAVVISLLLLGCSAGRAEAQLRPLDPMGWSTFERVGGTLVFGAGLYTGQRVSLAGVEGRLLELGSFQATWAYERVSVRLGGTLFRLFDDQYVFTDPLDDTRPPDGTRRSDAGDIRVSTIVRLTADDARVGAALRFGTRLPTTDNREGLGRDQADFFATVGVRFRNGPLATSLEAGAGVNGTRDPLHEQVDPILFAAAFMYEGGLVSPVLELAGQHDPRSSRDRRGNENIGEVRVGVVIGADRWVKVTAARGWTSYSPDFGLTVLFGTHF
jgi:hypothetical protein